MATRRQEKLARVVKEAVCDAIANHLGDPRITGFTSVTKVDIAPDIKSAEVFLSVFGTDEKAQRRTFDAIQHAHSKIQSIVAGRITAKYTPSLRFHMDENLKKTMDVLKIIEDAASQYRHDEPDSQDEFEGDTGESGKEHEDERQ